MSFNKKASTTSTGSSQLRKSSREEQSDHSSRALATSAVQKAHELLCKPPEKFARYH